MARILAAVSAALALVGSAIADSCQAGDLTAGALAVPGDSPAGCVCPAGQYFDNGCQVNSDCPSPLPSIGVVDFDSTGMGVTTADMSGSDSKVQFTLEMTPRAGVTYTDFAVAAPGAAPTGPCGKAVFDSILNGDPNTCKDQFTFIAGFSDLIGCGLTLSASNDATSEYRTYDATVRVSYSEATTLGTGDFATPVTRTAFVDYPIRVQFLSEYSAQIDSLVNVYAPQQIDFAITDQTIPVGGLGNPTLTFTYTTQYPYAITSFTNALTPSAGGITAELTSTASTCAATTDYTNSSTASAATCTKANNVVTFTLNGACEFGESYTLDFDVQCGTGIAAADCPLLAASPGTAVFDMKSENFCTDNATPNTINNVITITSFGSVASAVSTTTQNAWRYGDTAYFYMTFSGLPVVTLKMYQLERKFNGAGSFTQVAQGTDRNTEMVLAGFTAGAVGGVGTNYRFSLVMNNALLGVSSIQRGTNPPLLLKAYIEVTYQTSRRRRQTTSSGMGYSESDTSYIGAAETAEAAPSSAVRAAPILAVALALLSAIVIA